MISTNLFSISLNHFSVSIILLIPSSVFFFSVIELFISVSLLNLFIKHLVCLLNLCLHSFFKILSHLYYYYSKFFFQVACLPPLHLAFLGDFDLVPSSQKPPYFVSFSVSGLLSPGCGMVSARFSVPAPGCVSLFRLPVGGTDACSLMGGGRSCPSGGKGCQVVCLEVAVQSVWLQTLCLMMHGAVFLFC